MTTQATDRLQTREILVAMAAFAALCVVALSFAPQLSEPDDYAYRASIIAMTHGHFLSLSTAQFNALAAKLPGSGSGLIVPGRAGPAIAQWVQLSDGRWISEKDPGYPFFAAPFQLAGLIRLTPLFYGALGCLGLFIGGRRWLGRYGGTVAVCLFCSSGAALLFAWRDYMPTFTDASMIAAGSGALLWALLAVEATDRRRTWVGLLAFAALEAAVFVRYTNVVILICAVVAALVAWRVRAPRLPGAAVGWWLGSVAVTAAGIAVFDTAVYGGPLTSGYRPGEITFSLTAVPTNLRYMPPHLIEAMPMLVLGVAAAVWIVRRRLRSTQRDDARRDYGVALALTASWVGVWGLYATYTWTAHPVGSTLQVVRFYVPALGAISLLAAWLVITLPLRATATSVASVAAIAALFGLGVWSFQSTHQFSGTGHYTQRSGTPVRPGGSVQPGGSPPPASPGVTVRRSHG